MAGRGLDITQKQVTALCKGAAKAGYAPVIQVGKTWVRLIPEEHAISPQEERRIDDPDDVDPDSFQTFDEYRDWRDRNLACED